MLLNNCFEFHHPSLLKLKCGKQELFFFFICYLSYSDSEWHNHRLSSEKGKYVRFVSVQTELDTSYSK